MQSFKPAFYINITERCNMKCEYCPTYGENWESTDGLLPANKLIEIVQIAASLGLKSFRVSGGEPFIFPERVFEVLNVLNRCGISDIILNTNGFNLHRFAKRISQFKIAKLKISLDTVDASLFHEITATNKLETVMRGIDLALDLDLPTELNCVLYRRNSSSFWSLLDFCEEKGCALKVLDLVFYDRLVREESDPERFWRDQYLSLSVLHKELEVRYGSPRIVRLSNNRGIPMLQYEMNSGRALTLKDGAFGSTFGRLCQACAHFPCQEGLFHLSLSAGGNLTPCRLRRDVAVALSQLNPNAIRSAIVVALESYQEIEFLERTVKFPSRSCHQETSSQEIER